MINTPFNYTGNKFKLLDQILPEFDYNRKNFYDLFCGGGSVYTNIIDKFEIIYINDIIKDLIDIHKELIFNTEEFINKVIKLSPSNDNQEEFNKLRKEYNENKEASKLFALMLSSRNNLMRFNKKFLYNQTFGKRTFNNNTLLKINNFVNHLSKYKDKINFTNLSFENVNINENSMVYIDPPYGYCVEDNKIISKQISDAGYNCYWKKEDEIKLYEYIKTISNKCSFVMSNMYKCNEKTSYICEKLINDGFNYKTINSNYTKVSKVNKDIIEIIIKNF